MKREELLKRIENLNNDDFLGLAAYTAVCEDDNCYEDIGKSLWLAVEDCQTDRDLKFLNKGVIALSGCSIETLLGVAEKRKSE